MSLRGGALGASVLAVTLGACGSRSGLYDCFSDADCALRDRCSTQRCVANACVIVARTVCDDHDSCTVDSCDKKTGGCVFEHQSFDLDGDKHYQPLPGHQPGDPGSCGDDCDDTDPNAYPGNKEICDGVDNDCNGIVDDGARYEPRAVGSEVRVSSPSDDYAESGALARGGDKASLAIWVATRAQQGQPYVALLEDNGAARAPAKVLGSMPAAGGSASVAWTGDRYGVAWSDRRDGNYEIYFAAFDAQGNKLKPGDERITISDGFSLYPSLGWSGDSFYVVWQEETTSTQGWELQGQKIGLDGRLIGDIAHLTPALTAEQAPSLVARRDELGVAWVHGDMGAQRVFFSTFDANMRAKAAPRDLSGPRGGRGASLVWTLKGWVAAWYTPAATARTVFATLLADDGSSVLSPVRVSDGTAQSRDPSLVSLGDRVLAVWADDRDHNQGYELYARTLSADLAPLGPALRVTNAPGDSIGPVVAFGHAGSASVLFRDDRGAAPAAYFTTLACTMPP